VRIADRRFVLDFRRPDTALYSGACVIPDANATAQYYGNLASNALPTATSPALTASSSAA
jgi:hypothetical protein